MKCLSTIGRLPGKQVVGGIDLDTVIRSGSVSVVNAIVEHNERITEKNGADGNIGFFRLVIFWRIIRHTEGKARKNSGQQKNEFVFHELSIMNKKIGTNSWLI